MMFFLVNDGPGVGDGSQGRSGRWKPDAPLRGHLLPGVGATGERSEFREVNLFSKVFKLHVLVAEACEEPLDMFLLFR